jgi:acyl dehydratase
MISTHPHERFSAVVSLEPSATSAFAHAVGDTNPVHHDAEYAAASRFGRLLASGPQTTAHLLALTASHFSKRGAMLGLEFWVRFRRPVYADETITLEWLVVSVKKNSGLDGEIIDARPHPQGKRRNRRGCQRPRACHRETLKHDPEKWRPVFEKDHAQTNALKV